MLLRAFVIWCALLVVAMANGTIRVAFIIPRIGDAPGHVVSTLTLSAAILLVAFLTVGWLRPLTPNDALIIGGLWVALTMAFEFLAGHFLFATGGASCWRITTCCAAESGCSS